MKKLLIIARYTIYNLPDTVIFANGNKIINHYNASGNKWKTEYHTIIDAMYLPNTADGTVFEGNLADIHYTIYDGNIEYKYIVNSMGVDSLYEYVIHNTEGYIAYHPQNNTMTHYYYHQDHLGNICAVWDATHDSIVQQTLYYASGLPVSVSTGQDVQPYKYNGKEFVEMHGYDVYEYGARGYYATIGRFTSIDPLCEQTPWQSPYVYANNNWVNNIDWMGMSADGYTSVDPKQIAKLLAFLSKGNSLDDYDFEGEGWDVMEDWTFDESEGKLNIYVNHISGEIVPGLGGYIIPDAYVMVLSYYIEDLRRGHQLDESDVLSTIGLTNDIIGNYRCNDLYWIGKNGKLYFWYMVHKQGGYAYSQKVAQQTKQLNKLAPKNLGIAMNLYSIVDEVIEVFQDRSLTYANGLNVGLATISIICTLSSGPIAAGVLLGIGVFTAVDLIYGWTTGSSVTDRLDKKTVIEW